MVSTLGAAVTPSAKNTRASPSGWPPLPAPVTSISVTTAPATGALVLLSNTTPNGSTIRLACSSAAPQPLTDTVSRSFGRTLRRPSPRASGVRSASVVGTRGSMWNSPLFRPVSVATNDSVSPASADDTVICCVSARSGSRLQREALNDT